MGGVVHTHIISDINFPLIGGWVQSVTPHLSLGGEIFWAGQHRKSGVGYAARYSNDKVVI